MHRARILTAIGLGLAGIAGTGRTAATQEQPHQHMSGMPTVTETEAGTPLYTNLGDLHYTVTGSKAAQSYFDQGLRLTWGFNHEEAIASYTEATRQDSTCAMCWWGVAFALGPNINAPMDTSAVRPAWEALRKAQANAPRASATSSRHSRSAMRRTPRPTAPGSTPRSPRPRDRWRRSTPMTPRRRRSTPTPS